MVLAWLIQTKSKCHRDGERCKLAPRTRRPTGSALAWPLPLLILEFMDSAFAHLRQCLDELAPPEAKNWINQFLLKQQESFAPRPFYYAFSGATRRFPKVAVNDLALRFAALPDFQPHRWTLDQLARTVLLLSLVEQHPRCFLQTFRALLDTADMRESVALYSALPLLPEAEALVPLARDGLRSNIVDVFDAIALHNSFPERNFDEEGWNQMILKAIFIRRPLHRIQGVEARANAALAQSLSDLAHERWAANRPVPPELWRSCQGFATPPLAGDLARVLNTPEPGQKEAAALLIAADRTGLLNHLRSQVADLIPSIENGSLTWQSLGQALESGTN